MKANELKCTDLIIGNYLKRNNKIVKVNGLSCNEVKYTDNDKGETVYDIMFFQPIELTEEVLLKIGFSLTDKDYSCFEIWYNNTFIRYVQKFNLLYLENLISEEEGLHSEIKLYGIKYLHQLQNAYFILTDEKLNIEL